MQITASDPDPAHRGNITYDIYAPSGTDSTLAAQAVNSLAFYHSMLRQAFSVDRSTGAVSLRRALDRDFPRGFSNWQMNVVAADQSGSPTSKTGYGVVSVRLRDINDNDPEFDTCCMRGAVREGSPRGKVGLMSLPAF